jgi:hypothetical protein
MNNEYPPRHIPGFRPLVPAEPANDTAKLRERIAEIERVNKGMLDNIGECGACAEGLLCGSTMNEHRGCVYEENKNLKTHITELEEKAEKAQSRNVLCMIEAKKLTKRIAELERELKQANHDLADEMRDCANLREELATALTPRPIAEAGPVKEGFVRLYGTGRPGGVWNERRWAIETHFIDIRLPSDSFRAEYDRAVAEAGGHYEAWLQAKGGAA